jgi:hypothetical protein
MSLSDRTFKLGVSRFFFSLPDFLDFDCLRLWREIINMIMAAIGFFRNSSRNNSGIYSRSENLDIYSRSESSKMNSSSIVVSSDLAIL